MHAPFRGPRTRLASGRLRRLALAGTALAALTCTMAPVGPASGAPDPQPTDPPAFDADAVDSVLRKQPATGPARPLNLLLVGLDSRAGIPREVRDRLHVNGEACDCTDVMMLLHISRDRQRVSVVSIPRDSYVRYAPHKDPGTGTTSHRGKINGAHAHGGAPLTVRTVEQATGLRIDHYLETDFTGFVKTVDDLGGARVCTRKPLRDVNSGLDMAAGEHFTDGRTSLRYVRARHVSPPGDLGRVRRQQHLLAGMLQRLTSDEVAGSPIATVRAAQALRRTVRTDSGLGLHRLLRLAGELRGLRADRSEFATVPIEEFDHRVPEWGSTLTWDEPRAKAMFAALRKDRPLRSDPRLAPPPGVRPVGVSPALIRVQVEGGGDEGPRLEKELRSSGFAVVGRMDTGATAPGGGRDGELVITHAPGRERDAEVLAAALPDARVRAEAGHSDVLTVRPGATRTKVAKIVFDRSSVEGAPVTGRALSCDPSGGAAPGAGGAAG